MILVISLLELISNSYVVVYYIVQQVDVSTCQCTQTLRAAASFKQHRVVYTDK